MNLSCLLSRLEACNEAKTWASTQPDLETAWATCERPDWMLWLLHNLGHQDPKNYRLFACWCARSTPLQDGRTTWGLLTDARSKRAVEVAERFAVGEVAEDERVKARAGAAYAYAAAAYAAAAAADAAAYAAAASAYAAAAAAYAYADYADYAAAAADAADAADAAAADAAAYAAAAAAYAASAYADYAASAADAADAAAYAYAASAYADYADYAYVRRNACSAQASKLRAFFPYATLAAAVAAYKKES